jgi:pimeloyl-ACP methyl ester carboxylesterase
MMVSFAKVNGIAVAYTVQGEGPPLVLVMGYRLNSAAWPPKFIEQLARKFTVITLDNRGTGRSDKPVKGYAIANMARDVCGSLTNSGSRKSTCWAIQWEARSRRSSCDNSRNACRA